MEPNDDDQFEPIDSNDQVLQPEPVSQFIEGSELTLHAGPTDEEIRMTAIIAASNTIQGNLAATGNMPGKIREHVVIDAKAYEKYIRTGE